MLVRVGLAPAVIPPTFYSVKLVFQKDLPDRDIPINGLTLFSSSVGRHSLSV